VDFGLAKLRGLTRLTKTGTTLGTVAYMSPEQAQGKEVDQRSDIWSLGVILYEMLAGKLPFPGEYDQAVLYAVINEEPERLTKIRPEVTSGLEQIVCKALAKERDERYPHLADLIVDLRRIGKDSSPELTAVAPAKKKSIPYFIYPALAIGLAAVAIGGFLWLKNRRPSTPVIDPAVTSSKPSIAVFYFENKTGRKDLDIWRDGLSTLLITDLSQSKYLRILSEERLLTLMKDLNLAESQKYSSEEIKQLALRGGCQNVLHGYYLQTGKSFIITASLQDATSGEIIDSFKASGEGEESITTSVDEITRKIKLSFPLTAKQLADDVDVGIGQVTTRSPEALKYYLAGRRYHHQAEYTKAIEMLNKAIELDPAFAMAYSSLSSAYCNIGNAKKEEESSKKALQYSDRVSIKERAIIRAQAEPNPVKQIKIFDRILNDYPDNEIILRFLGEAYFYAGDMEQSLKLRIKAYSVSPDSFLNCGNAADGYVSRNPGDYAQAEAIFREYAARHPEWKGLHFVLALCYTIQRKWDLAEQEIEKQYMLDPQDVMLPFLRGNLAFFQGDWDRAEAEYKKINSERFPRFPYFKFYINAELADIRGKTKTTLKSYREAAAYASKKGDVDLENWLHSYLAYLYFREGKFREALAEIDQDKQLPLVLKRYLAQAEIQFQRALLHTAMGDRQLGEKYFSLAGETLSEEDKGTKAWQRLFSLYRGQMELVTGNYGRAIELLQRFLSLIPYQRWRTISQHWLEESSWRRSDCLYMIASAHYRLGDLQSAIRELEEIPTLTYGRGWNPQTLARSYLLAGQIYQKLGQKEKALENYRQFVNLWKDCDPPLRPLVDEARREITKLEKQG
jgi:tetratricopeptide (TPR) repeat protein/TolB-like protein